VSEKCRGRWAQVVNFDVETGRWISEVGEPDGEDVGTLHGDGKAGDEGRGGGGGTAREWSDSGGPGGSLDKQVDLLGCVGVYRDIDLRAGGGPDSSGSAIGSWDGIAAVLGSGGVIVAEVVGHLELLHSATGSRSEASCDASRTPDGVGARWDADLYPAELVGRDVVGAGAAIVVELGVGEKGSGDPLRVPVIVVVNCDDGAGPTFED